MTTTLVFNIFRDNKRSKLSYPDRCRAIEDWIREIGIKMYSDRTDARNKYKIIYAVRIPENLKSEDIFDELRSIPSKYPFVDCTDHY